DAAFGQHGRGVGSDAVAAGAVDPRSHAETVLDRVAQPAKFRLFDLARQVAGEGIARAHFLIEGRIHPRMELDAYLGLAGGGRTAEDFGGLARLGDWPVDQIDRYDALALAEVLKPGELRHVSEAVPLAGQRLVPVEFLFGVDGEQESLPERRCESGDRCARRRIGYRSHPACTPFVSGGGW